MTVGFLFLEETHQDKRNRNDVGLVLGRQLVRGIPCLGSKSPDTEDAEEARRGANDEKGDYQPIPTSPQMTATIAGSNDDAASPMSEKVVDEEMSEPRPEPKVSFYRSLTKQIKLIILSYGLLAL